MSPSYTPSSTDREIPPQFSCRQLRRRAQARGAARAARGAEEKRQGLPVSRDARRARQLRSLEPVGRGRCRHWALPAGAAPGRGVARVCDAARALACDGGPRLQVYGGDGFARRRAWLPPRERRGLTFLDPPYERTQLEFTQVIEAL